MEKEREVERPVEPPAERDDVRVAGSRCPYCHEAVARESADVCRDCLARHHGGCWTEGARCGACGSAHVLRPVLPPLTPDRLRELYGAALRREGYPEAEVERVLGPPADRCPTPGCGERGVARGNASMLLFCPAHAAAARDQLRAAGWILILVGLIVAASLCGIGIAEHEGGVIAAGVTIGVALGIGGSLLLHTVRQLPPIPVQKGG